MATEEADAFRDLSILWVKCGQYQEEIEYTYKRLQLEEMLCCPVCLCTFSAPKRLQCEHVFCQRCLIPLQKKKVGRLYIDCPLCRQATLVPNTGLQPDDKMESLLKEIPAATNPVKKARHCSLHSDEEVELYCETCGQLICLSCAENGGEHQNHCYNDISEALKQYEKDITPSLERIERQHETFGRY